jgi:hypothetical protein
MKTIIDKFTGQVLYATIVEVDILENEIAIDEVLTESFENPYFDFETRNFYENAKLIHNIVI